MLVVVGDKRADCVGVDGWHQTLLHLQRLQPDLRREVTALVQPTEERVERLQPRVTRHGAHATIPQRVDELLQVALLQIGGTSGTVGRRFLERMPRGLIPLDGLRADIPKSICARAGIA
jgi:hypothetical protein